MFLDTRDCTCQFIIRVSDTPKPSEIANPIEINTLGVKEQQKRASGEILSTSSTRTTTGTTDKYAIKSRKPGDSERNMTTRKHVRNPPQYLRPRSKILRDTNQKSSPTQWSIYIDIGFDGSLKLSTSEPQVRKTPHTPPLKSETLT